RLNRPFFTRVRLGRPFVTMKTATSLDGYVAAARGARTQLTGSAAATAVQRERAEIDALAVGSETILVDDPLLTVRVAYRYRPLVRVVFDRRLRTPPTARLLTTLGAGPVIVVTNAPGDERARARAHALRDAGAQVECVEPDNFLESALKRLATAGVT